MSIELRVPNVGESISEVQIGEWTCKEGDWVESDKPLVSIETDKVTVEISAPAAGRLTKIVLPNGAAARVGDVVGVFESEANPSDVRVEANPSDMREPAERVSGETPSHGSSPAPATRVAVSGSTQPVATASHSSADVAPSPLDEGSAQAVPWASPAARRALAERGMRAEDIGKLGDARLLKEDVVRVVERGVGNDMAATPDEEAVKMSPLRMRVAERLLEAQQNMALLTTFNEIDMTEVQRVRQEAKELFLEKHGIKLGLLSFFVRAVLDALKAFPVVNAEVRGNEIVYKNHYDIGIAIGGGKGLVVPVLRNVERLGFASIERAIANFATRAKQNKLELRELSGGTFTISNGGVYGSMLSTPIVNPPQSAILGLHAITERPVARSGQVVIRPMMYVALTYDHRIIDGREAVSFLRTIKDLIESPIRILLEY